MIKLLIRVFFVLCLVTLVSAKGNDFTGRLFDNVQDIVNIINNEVHATSFLQAIKVNPAIAFEQAIIGLVRKDLRTALTLGQLCELHGYGYDIHYVETDDGYILQVYRIYNPRITNSSNVADPILLIHGLIVSGSSWVFNDGQSLAFYFADRNKVVWVINQRGTTYSTNHTTLNPYLDLNFWNFTFTEFGLQDLPATVRYIKKESHYDKITVVGYSQGTLALLTYLSLNPSASEDFDLIYLVAPVGYLGYVNGIVNAIPRLALTNSIIGSLRIPFPPLLALTFIFDALCTLTITLPICLELANGISGFSTSQKQIQKLINFASEVDRTSFKNAAHFLQSLNYDHVHLYDNGPVKNLEVYGSTIPPALPYHLVNTKRIILISALNDFLSKQENVQKLRNSFTGRALVDHIITVPEWSHFDYVISKNANEYFNEPLYQMYEEYSNNAKGMNRRPD